MTDNNIIKTLFGIKKYWGPETDAEHNATGGLNLKMD